MRLSRVIALTLAVTTVTALTAFFSEADIGEKTQLPFEEIISGAKENDDEKPFALIKSGAFIDESELYVSAKSAILCTDDGTVLYGKQEDVPLPMASITKVMTAVVALEMSDDLSKVVKVPFEAVGIEGSSVYLKDGESVTLEMLIYSSMLESANDATTALAISLAGSQEEFVTQMNRKAKALGMESTSFANPHGLPAADC